MDWKDRRVINSVILVLVVAVPAIVFTVMSIRNALEPVNPNASSKSSLQIDEVTVDYLSIGLESEERIREYKFYGGRNEEIVFGIRIHKETKKAEGLIFNLTTDDLYLPKRFLAVGNRFKSGEYGFVYKPSMKIEPMEYEKLPVEELVEEWFKKEKALKITIHYVRNNVKKSLTIEDIIILN
jgi:hypothetical protein